MPAAACPATGQWKVYVCPFFSVTVTVEVLPGTTILPSLSSPLPFTAMPCSCPEDFGFVMISLTQRSRGPRRGFDRYVAAMLLGVDVGGTFTDAALLDGERLISAKAPSTPKDQSEGVIEAVNAALDQADARAEDVERFVHGMTVGTNALLENKVARTALVATDGFTDLEELGRQARPELYRLCAGHPPPLVPPERRIAARERCGPDGVLKDLDQDALRADLAGLEDAESV